MSALSGIQPRPDLRTQIERDLDERTLCIWNGSAFSGKSITFVRSRVDGVYNLLKEDGETLKEINLTGEDPQSRSTLIDRLIASIPETTPQGNVVFPNTQVLYEWEKEEPPEAGGLKKVGLLKISNQSLCWRITSGKIQTIIKGHFQVFCYLPIANPRHSVTYDWIGKNGYPVSWPLMTMSYRNNDYFQDHALEKIEQSESTQKIKLIFSATYVKVRSKFNADVFLTPYEWGVTLISYSSKCDSLDGGVGHSAIIIESVKNGRYYGEMTDVNIPRDPDSLANALEVNLTQRVYMGKDFYFTFKSEPNPKKGFKNLKHTRTWIRKKESVQKMLDSIQDMRRRQTKEKPLFFLDRLGKHDSLTARGVLSQVHELVFPTGVYDGLDGKQALEWEEREKLFTNCIIWALERLQEADINVDKGMITKYFASIPSDYASLSTSTLDESDHPKSRKSWVNTLKSQINNANTELKQIFVGGFLEIPRQNFFVVPNCSCCPPSITDVKTKRLVEEQFLSSFNYKWYLKSRVRDLLLYNMPTGIRFNSDEDTRFLEPLMRAIIKTGDLSKILLSQMRAYKVHLTIKDPKDWQDKEEYLIEPKTYAKTIELILAQILRIEVCKKMQLSMRFGHPTHQLVL